MFAIMQLKRLKLRKNNWSSESYRFDEVFTESASQKRVYEVVAKPVVEVKPYFMYLRVHFSILPFVCHYSSICGLVEWFFMGISQDTRRFL